MEQDGDLVVGIGRAHAQAVVTAFGYRARTRGERQDRLGDPPLQTRGEEQRGPEREDHQQADPPGVALQLRGQEVGAGVEVDPTHRLPVERQPAHDLDAAEAEQGDVEEHALPRPCRPVRLLARVTRVAGEGLPRAVVEDRPSDLRLLAQAGEVLRRGLRRVEDQGGEGILPHHNGQHVQVAHHLAAEHPHVVDHEKRAGDAQREQRDGRGDAHQPPADGDWARRAHSTTSATS